MAATSASMSNGNPLPKSLAEKLFGFCTSQAILSALELGIFDVLHDSPTSVTSKFVSDHLSIDPDATDRLLDTLVALELLEKANSNPAQYRNTNMSRQFLLKSSPNSVHDLMPMLKTSYKLFDNLTWAVREGENQWKRTWLLARVFLTLISVYNYVFGACVDLFSFIYATKRGLTAFLRGLSGTCKMDAGCFATAFDLSKFRSVCDLGGATGDIAYAVSNHYPNTKITVMDLPKVVECASHFKPPEDQCPNQGNVDFLGGDFFRDKLPDADLFILTRIIQSFDEPTIDKLLGKIYEHLKPGGAVLIGEKLLHDDKSGPLLGHIGSLNMLVAGHKGSRERSGLEYQHLLERHGFVDVEYKVTGGTFLDAVFARKPYTEMMQ